MSNGANLANYGDEFGPNAVSKVMSGTGGDNSEQPAAIARAGSYPMTASGAVNTAKDQDDIEIAKPKGANYLNTDNPEAM